MSRDNSYLIGNKFAEGSNPNKTAFKVGHVPWNKGKKGLRLSPTTEFKKGQRGIKWVQVGTKTIRTDKGGKQRRWIKVSEPNIWIEYAKFVWIQNNGAISKGYVIHHIDKNTLNDDISNLALVSRKAHINIHRVDLRGVSRQSQTNRRYSGVTKYDTVPR